MSEAKKEGVIKKIDGIIEQLKKDIEHQERWRDSSVHAQEELNFFQAIRRLIETHPEIADGMNCPRCGLPFTDDDIKKTPDDFLVCKECGTIEHKKCIGPRAEDSPFRAIGDKPNVTKENRLTKNFSIKCGLLLSETKREIVIGKDISKCCHGPLRQSRVYPFGIYCDECNRDLKFEHEIIFKKKA